jgi:electron transfer DM13
MLQRAWLLTTATAVALIAAVDVHASSIGMTAELSTLFHNVSGTVTVVDEDTFRVDDFTYDGGGPAVYFYLGADESNAAFGSGPGIDPLLTGSAYDGTQGPLFFDLPAGESFLDYDAISVWCIDFNVNFGSGTFALAGDLNSDGFIGIDDLGIILSQWNQPVPSGSYLDGDPSGDGFVGIADLNIVLGNWNAGTPPTGTANTIPEPASVLLLSVPLCLLCRSRAV